MGFLDRFRRTALIELDDQQQRAVAQLRDQIAPGDARPSGNLPDESRELREIIKAFEAGRLRWEEHLASPARRQAQMMNGSVVEWLHVDEVPELSEPFLLVASRQDWSKAGPAAASQPGMRGVITAMEKARTKARVLVLDVDQRAHLHSFLHVDHQMDGAARSSVGLSDLNAPSHGRADALPDGSETDLSL